MPDDRYSLADLARLGDVTPRTVRYYVSQGLLPSPEAAGSATRYGEGHLARLRLIRRLQREHLPLAEIRARLERLGDDDVQAALDAGSTAEPEPPTGPAATLDFVRGLMVQAGVHPRVQDRVAETAAIYEPQVPDEYPQPAPPASAPPPEPARTFRPAIPLRITLPPAAPSEPAGRSTAGDRSTWERLSIAPDVEIHVRRPLDRITNKRVERLARIARELFEEDA